MNIERSSYSAMFTGVFTAITASLCCITPVLALIAGTSGMASTFAWLEAFRPFFIGLTVLVLGFAWYQKLKSKSQQEIDCACENDVKPSFLQSKRFLLFVTLFAGLMLAFPYFSGLFYAQPTKEIIYVQQDNMVDITFTVEGMTCSGCENHIESEVNKLDGIVSVKASYEKSNTTVKYDRTKVTEQRIIKAINNTGYNVSE
ncbi:MULTISPECIES: mercuric transport protein MerTP [Flavobacteriaceae]|uniref:Mercuric transport protein MerT n=2 Tax=Flagellimonas TaxID=444459 RepID=A0A1M7BAG8_9FLAO|nr:MULTISPECIES: mercuric transport protein MerTP [Allomuricauda]MEC3965609.1 mercuric transport protein MerTP [Muricauda sp. SYSU M86414]MEC4265475.1 mercuric transport protein MerTP [Muricauda sp. SYSU M84420]SFC38924.1 copper ion binding protein [Allomuricauda taeanensis]SHL51980.1 copper ion binding protein [Allomuricauda taeanensis]